jgi:endonuclease I
MRKQSTLLLLVLLVSTNWLLAQIPSGYYTPATGLTGAQLKTALYNIIKDHTVKSYDYLWTAYQTTDKKANGKVWDMYSDVPGGTPPYEYTFGTNQCGNYSGENSCYNREHSFPKSWFNDASPMVSDLFHIYPTDGYVNGRRSNYPYGTVSSPSWTSQNGCKLGPCSAPGYTGTVFEPIDEYKGDFARTYFYMVTRYENLVVSWNSNAEAQPTLNGTTYPCFDTWILNVLLAWNAADPVSAKEISRNNAVYAIQVNRNPYIDHPEYVDAVWGTSPAIAEPTNHALSFAVSSTTSTSITLTWNDNDGAQPAGKFLILANTTGVFSTPVDGVPIADDIVLSDNSGAVNVNHGVQTYTWSGLTPSTIYYFTIFPFTNSAANTNFKTDGTVPAINGKTSVAPSLTTGPTVLSGFSYVTGSGPSASQSYSLSGEGLTPASGNITVTGSADYQVSLNNTSFTSSLNVAYTGGTLAPTQIYVRLKSGLTAANYNSELVSNIGGNASTSNVTCSGSVAQPATLTISPSVLTGFTYETGFGPSASQSFSLSGTALTPASGNISVTGTPDFEVSVNNTSFSNSLDISYTGGTLTVTPVYIWLKSGLLMGNYSSEDVSVIGGGATAKIVTCSGNVTDFTGLSQNNGTNQAKVFLKEGYFYISVPSIESKQAEIGIFNATGQQFGRTRQIIQGLVKVPAPAVAGIYIVRISSGKDFFTAKVSVNRK